MSWPIDGEHRVRAVDLAGQEHAEGDGGVDVAAADRPDDVGHDGQREAEAERRRPSDADVLRRLKMATPGPPSMSTSVPTSSATRMRPLF